MGLVQKQQSSEDGRMRSAITERAQGTYFATAENNESSDQSDE
jgi:hypothetical protein